VEEYVVAWARELPARAPIRILVHLPASEARKDEARHVAEAISNYFAYQAGRVALDLKQLFRVGRTSLAIGVCVLAACSVAGRLAESLFGDAYLGAFFGEGLVILGWVANWRPIQIFLYDWWPLARRRRLLRRLAGASVELAPIETSKSRASRAEA
jgi:hypothetical protein